MTRLAILAVCILALASLPRAATDAAVPAATGAPAPRSLPPAETPGSLPSLTTGNGPASVGVAPDPNSSGAIGTALVGGWATWYAADGMIAAAGPALREHLGRDWRGTAVRVTANGHTVVVRLTDWCACGKRHGKPTLLDLSDDAFRRLAPLSVGVIGVEVEPFTLPETDR